MKYRTGRPKGLAELSPKQEVFCKEYIIDFNGTQAAIRAGYSKKTARMQAYENLTKPYIQSQIQAEIDKRAERVEKTGDDVVRGLWAMAELDLANFITVAEGGEVQAIPFDKLPEGATKLISKIKEKRTIVESADGSKQSMFSNLEYELPDKVSCYEKLARCYGLFKETLSHTGKDGGPILLSQMSDEEIEKRVREILAKRR